ncbi:Adenine deaminase [Rhodobacteraceae bacterium THAF1]|uniref:adenine deaminase n=1 Tax=Palleronia sp. THAF1 TaxID=2587842 RepID=UPI000F4095D6|nr:adenine deaminase [Palleronia sp. THAF1]QFU09301.1 Adenine deaminase [Palleronia sp. THAF1]VDC26685.1 Adenine deaminase [Rhodobacteraceae bacterium THAF1]
MSDLPHLIAVARGDAHADVVLRGGTVLDVVTGDLVPGDVGIVGGVIASVGHDCDGPVRDVTGLTLVPGFIDTHLHIESSLVTPSEFARCVGPRGTTTAIWDPHEIANVLGVEALEWALEQAGQSAIDIRVMLSSCVPSSHLETSGARIDAEALAALADHPRALGLAEFMNYPGVVGGDAGCMAKLGAFAERHIDGHAPLLSGRHLNAYVAAGIRTEHEATSAEEAREKLRKGMRILIREGSVSKDLHALLPLMTERLSPYLAFCTDDRNPLDIGEEGHLDHMIRTAIAGGVDPLVAYRVASLSGAEAFGLKDRGQIAPGKRADIVAVGSLAMCDAQAVWSGGAELPGETRQAGPVIGRSSVQVPAISADMFRHSGSGPVPVIGINEGQILTDHLTEEIPATDGDQRPDPARDLARVTVIERHGRSGGHANGFVRGFGMQRGAIASTVCHDHHNLIVVGADYDDMALAATRLDQIEGGFCVVDGGVVLAELALPVAGLMSERPFEEVRASLEALRTAAKGLGVVLNEPFLQLAFIALPVIPHLKITDLGMVDVDRFEMIGRKGG